MRIANDTMTVAGSEGPFDMSTSFVSDGFWLGHIVNFSIQATFTGSPAGTFQLEVSNDKGYEDKKLGGWDSSGVSNWTINSDSVFTIAAAGDITWNAQNVGYRWVRVRWTRTSGSGSTSSLRVNAKGV